MFAVNALQMATRQIRRNGMRSILTTLGIVIGTGAVIAMVTLGRGATARITSDIGKLGRNMLIVVPGARSHGGPPAATTPFELDDAKAITRDIRGLSAVAPTSGRGVLAVYGNQNWRTTLNGADNAFFNVRLWEVGKGRLFTEGEERSGTPVCVLGASVVENLFGAQDPLGATIRIGNVACQVVGVLASKGRSSMGDDQDDLVVMPLLSFQRRVAGTQDVSAILVSAQDADSTGKIQEDLTALMRQRRHIQPGRDDDFVVRDMKEVAELVDRTTGVLTALFAAIAAVSLLVGGIGIMNIMLVSVTERTREIGIRLAIGAREREVLLQFLIEAVVLSMLGGALGVALGLAGSAGVARALAIPFIWDPSITVIAFLFSAAVGVAFGFMPARKAARLNPIDALRFE